MISPTGAPGTFSDLGVTNSRTQLGRQEFLTLLIAQLQNQDPLSPLKAHEFASQLAQFSTVEQLTQLNSRMDLQTGMIQLASLLSEAAFSSSLVGRHVVAEGNQVSIPDSGQGRIRVDIGGSGGRATLRLLDSSGTVVETRDLGSVAPGSQDIMLPSDLPAGSYRYELEVIDADGNKVPVSTFTTGVVSAVQFKNGLIFLRIGSLEISLDDLMEIGTASSQTIADGDSGDGDSGDGDSGDGDSGAGGSGAGGSGGGDPGPGYRLPFLPRYQGGN